MLSLSLCVALSFGGAPAASFELVDFAEHQDRAASACRVICRLIKREPEMDNPPSNSSPVSPKSSPTESSQSAPDTKATGAPTGSKMLLFPRLAIKRLATAAATPPPRRLSPPLRNEFVFVTSGSTFTFSPFLFVVPVSSPSWASPPLSGRHSLPFPLSLEIEFQFPLSDVSFSLLPPLLFFLLFSLTLTHCPAPRSLPDCGSSDHSPPAASFVRSCISVSRYCLSAPYWLSIWPCTTSKKAFSCASSAPFSSSFFAHAASSRHVQSAGHPIKLVQMGQPLRTIQRIARVTYGRSDSAW